MTLQTSEDTPIDIALNVSDADGDPLVVFIDSLPQEGKLTNTADGREITAVPFSIYANAEGKYMVTYTPIRSYLFKCKRDPSLFGFYAKDPADAESPMAYVDINVTLVNDPPVLSAPSQATTLTVFPAVTSTLLTPIIISDPDMHLLHAWQRQRHFHREP
jgi:hypothetical protein